MKKLFAALVVVGAVLMLGCAQQQQPQEEVITIGVTDKITDLDPANAYDFYTWEVLNNIMGG